MKVHRINTIAELQAEQDRLVANMRVARKELSRSFSTTSKGGRDFLLKNILLPVGAIGLGVFAAQKISKAVQGHEEMTVGDEYEASIGEGKSGGWFSKLMLVLLPVVQQLFLKVKADENADGHNASSTDGQQNGLQTNGTPTSMLATLIPIAIPLAQQYFLKKSEEANQRSIKLDMDGEVMEGTFAAKQGGASSIFESLYKLLPVVLPLVQQYFAPTPNSAENEAKPSQADEDVGQYSTAAAY